MYKDTLDRNVFNRSCGKYNDFVSHMFRVIYERLHPFLIQTCHLHPLVSEVDIYETCADTNMVILDVTKWPYCSFIFTLY